MYIWRLRPCRRPPWLQATGHQQTLRKGNCWLADCWKKSFVHQNGDFEDPEAPFGDPWHPFRCSRDPWGHLLRHLRIQTWIFIDLGCILEASWEPRWDQFGHKFVILDAGISVGIRTTFWKGFWKGMWPSLVGWMCWKHSKYDGFHYISRFGEV